MENDKLQTEMRRGGERVRAKLGLKDHVGVCCSKIRCNATAVWLSRFFS